MFDTPEVRILKTPESKFFIAVSLIIGILLQASLTLLILLTFLGMILLLKVKDVIKGIFYAHVAVLASFIIGKII